MAVMQNTVLGKKNHKNTDIDKTLIADDFFSTFASNLQYFSFLRLSSQIKSSKKRFVF